MTNVVGEAVIHVRTDTATSGPAVTEEGAKAGKGYASGFVSNLKGIAAGIVAVVAVQKIKGFLTDALTEARESQKVSAATEALIKSTGGAANLTAAQVGQLSTTISNKIGVDDEAVQSAANLVLAFKNVRDEAGKGNDVFSQTVQAGQDLAAAGFGSATSASKLLAKALNDPEKGISSLTRVLGPATDAQKKHVKALVDSGRTLDAQKFILKQVQDRVGGVAAATATNGEKMSVAWANVKETIGTLLLPVIDKVEGAITNKVLPAITGFVDEVKNGTGAGGQFRDVMTTIGHAIGAVAGFLNDHRDAVKAVLAVYAIWKTTTLVMAAAQAILNAALAANPIGLIVLALAGLVVGLIYAYKHSETFRNIVQAALAGVVAAFHGLEHAATSVFESVKGAITSAVHFIQAHWGLIVSIIGGPLGIIVVQVIKHFDKIKSFITLAVQVVIGSVKGWVHFAQGVIGAVNDIASAVGRLPGKIRGIAGDMFGAGKAIIGRLLDGIRAIGTGAGGIADSVLNAIKGAVNSMIDRLNSVLEFSFNTHIPGVGTVTINPPNVGHLATGTPSWRGGLAVVGERGPELAFLPRGTRVIPNNRTAQTVGGMIDYTALAQALAAAGVDGRHITIAPQPPTGDPEAASMAVFNRLATAGVV